MFVIVSIKINCSYRCEISPQDENANCNVGRNVEQSPIFDATYTRNLKVHIERQPRKPKMKGS